ncbi:MAG TPA: hypothetical protein VMZ05_09035 [Spirochaetota bacterium]|nr:hypothetical protein [Spirochaetota bacterium]
MPQIFLRFFLPVFLLLPLYSVFADNATSVLRLGYPELWPVHAVLMSLSFALLLAGTIISGAFKKKRWWLKAHRRLQWTGGISGITGFATAVLMVSVSTGVHFRLPHSISGLVGTVLIIAALALGLAIFKVKTEKKKRFRTMHRWTGRIVLSLMTAVIIVGLIIAGIL